MPLTANRLTLHQAHQLLELNGIDWSFGWFKTQVYCGKIPSHKELNTRVVLKTDVETIIRQKKQKAKA